MYLSNVLVKHSGFFVCFLFIVSSIGSFAYEIDYNDRFPFLDPRALERYFTNVNESHIAKFCTLRVDKSSFVKRTSWSILGPTVDLGPVSVTFDILSTVINLFRAYKHSERIGEFVRTYSSWDKRNFEGYFGVGTEHEYEYDPYPVNEERYYNVLSQHQLYQFEGFREYIRELPRFERYISDLYDYMNAHGDFRESTRKLPGFKDKKFEKIVEDLYYSRNNDNLFTQAHFPSEKTISPPVKQPPSLDQQIRSNTEQVLLKEKEVLHTLYESYEEEYEEFYDERTSKSGVRIKKRYESFKEVVHENNVIWKKQTYNLSHDAQQLLKEYNADSAVYSNCFGNQVQQVLHGEFVDIIHEAAVAQQDVIGMDMPQVNFIPTLVDFSDVGCSYNKAGHVLKSSTIADFCWSILDYTHAAAKGMGQGTINTGNMALHPIDTVNGMVFGTAQLSCHLAKVLVEAGNVWRLSLMDPVQASYKVQEHREKIKAVWQAIEAERSALSGPEQVEKAAEFLTELYLTGKCLGALGKLFNGAHTKAIKLVEAVGHDIAKASEVVLVTVEGIEVTAMAEVYDTISLATGNTGKAANIIKNTAQAGHVAQKLPKVTKSVSHIIHDQHEVKQCKKIFDQMISWQDNLLELPYEHVLGIEIESTIKASGRIKERLKGFHHDFMQRLEKSGVVKMVNKVVCPKTECYMADVIYGGRTYKGKTFFPSHMTKTEVLESMVGAYENLIKAPLMQDNGRYLLNGFAKNNIPVEMVVNRVGNRMVTFYPADNMFRGF